MLLRVYVDDSSDQTQDRVVLAGAFVGWYHQWNRLQQEWRKVLKRAKIRYFRSTECRSLQGEFSKFRDDINYPIPRGREAANEIRESLDAIIHASGVMGVAACVPMKDYKEIRSTQACASEIFPSDAFEIALQALFQLIYETVDKEMKPDIGPQTVAIICDQSSSSPRIAKMFNEFVVKNPSYGNVLQSLVHLDDKKYPQLQAADLMAHLAKDRFCDWLVDPQIYTNKPELTKRLKQLGVYSIACCHKDWLMAALKNERLIRGYD